MHPQPSPVRIPEPRPVVLIRAPVVRGGRWREEVAAVEARVARIRARDRFGGDLFVVAPGYLTFSRFGPDTGPLPGMDAVLTLQRRLRREALGLPAGAGDLLPVPITLMTGRHDDAAARMIELFRRRHTTGLPIELLIGPGTLAANWAETFGQALRTMRGEAPAQPVRFHDGEWRDAAAV
ncbi:hypothetical protein [Actinoplanes sp. NPDC023714]|uniref:hypothetical protein n=1 Tax=Actinoplanes sp. NPDC023714 TaxID=3154322 RepID=UPI0033C6A9E3